MSPLATRDFDSGDGGAHCVGIADRTRGNELLNSEQKRARTICAIAVNCSDPICASNISLLENARVEIGKRRAEQLAKAFDVHPAIIMFPEYEADAIGSAA